jgi:hypothetical protein
MAEQRPFKPFVEGSSPSALTKVLLDWRTFYFVVRPHAIPVQKSISVTGMLFCLLIFLVIFQLVKFIQVFEIVFV